MKFLKTAKQMAPERSIKYLLHRHLSGPDPARPLSRVHASDLTKDDGLCPRYFALHDVTKKRPKDGWLTTSENVTFHMGRVLQDSVVNWFADMGKAVCHWRCVSCNQLHEFQTRPMKCSCCGTKVFRPEEVRFTSAETGASCGVDMLLALGEAKLRPVELKTMDKDKFKTLLAPLAEHRLRTNLYLRIMAESDHPWATMVNHHTSTVFYISKGGYGCSEPLLKKWGISELYSPFKEFEVSRDDTQTDALVRPARAVKLFREGKAGMPVGVCSTAFAKRAVTCPYKSACWSGEYPPTHDWRSA